MKISKKATTIAVINQKGGTGKTTTCENLGVGLAMEGTARYIEFHACPGGYDLDANDWLYRTDISQYMYATGFNIVRLLDKLGVDYKTRLFDEGLALDGLLPE
mgnify:CR=1 FL=1